MKDSDRIIEDALLRRYLYAAASAIHGTGLYAGRDFSAGEYIGTYWGPETSVNGRYVLWVYDTDDEQSATGRDGRNLLRFLNHAEHCNAVFDEYDLYAKTDIAKDQEITIDYGEDPGADE